MACYNTSDQEAHPLFAATDADMSMVFVELGAAIIGLAILARLAHRLGFSAIPLYLLGGLAFGNGGLLPLRFSEEFIHVGSEVGVILLLFMLGLEYTGAELKANLRTGFPAGVMDFVLNFPPGLVMGWLLGWTVMASVLLGGVTYISSSGIIARVLEELKRLNNPETPSILSVLVLEDLAMAVFLPLVAVLLVGQGLAAGAVSVLVALVTVTVVLFVALRDWDAMSRLLNSRLRRGHSADHARPGPGRGGRGPAVAGLVGRRCLSRRRCPVGTAGEANSPLARARPRPVRGAVFLFFGLQIDPATLPPVLWQAAVLGVVTVLHEGADRLVGRTPGGSGHSRPA